jgi:hypothetical protein
MGSWKPRGTSMRRVCIPAGFRIVYPGMHVRDTAVQGNSLVHIVGERWKDEYIYNTERRVN